MPVILLWACASDTNLFGKDPDATVVDTVDTATRDTGVATTADEERCDGVDNDGDGWVDEGFTDADGNGRADCADATCPDPALADAGPADTEDCSVAGDPDVWALEEEWFVDLGDLGTWVTPFVGQLTDDDGDGAVGAGDTPDIVYALCGFTPEVGVIAGDGSGVVWRAEIGCVGNDPILADLDGDGASEVVFSPRDAPLVAYRGDGTPFWTGSAAIPTYTGMTACDVEGDGTVEIISSVGIFDGATGALRTPIEVAAPPSYATTVCADLDVDGTKELIFGGTVMGADGVERWSVGADNFGVMAAPIQADGDEAAELVVTGPDVVTLADDDGSILWTDTLVSSLTGAPCVADLDGDGAQEFVTSGNTALEAWEVDGTRLWRADQGDSSGFAGCSTFDVDRDGLAEVLFAGERSFSIYDGATGATRFTTTDHRSATMLENPIVADVDGDDSAEVVLMSWSESGTGGVAVWGHPDDILAPVGPTWGIHDFDGANQADDGGLPAAPTPSWAIGGTFRGRPAGPPVSSEAANLAVHIVDVCVADCTYGPTSVVLRVENTGGVAVPAGATLTLVEEGATVWSGSLAEVPAGQALAEIEVALGVSTGRFTATVTTDAAECVTDDNVATWTDSPCP